MTQRSVTHGTFVIERSYPVPPARVFKAFADPKAKAQWFVGPEDWNSGPNSLDFRVGGTETNVGGPKGGPVHTYRCLYQDIVPDERIVYTYDMLMDEVRISVSLATLEFKASDKGTHLVLTEMGAFLDGFDKPAQREEGTQGLFQALDAYIATLTADA
jgi:uncharacterized protein YndB with AHSA1/START domain